MPALTRTAAFTDELAAQRTGLIRRAAIERATIIDTLAFACSPDELHEANLAWARTIAKITVVSAAILWTNTSDKLTDLPAHLDRLFTANTGPTHDPLTLTRRIGYVLQIGEITRAITQPTD
jgi:hypothetical protein